MIQNFYNSVSEKVNTNNATSVDKIQAMKLIDFVNSHYLNQKVVTPTREDNILDYVFTNKDNFVKDIEVEINLYISDHNTIISDVDMTEITNTEDKKVNHCDTVIPEYNLMDATEEQWTKAKEWLEAIDLNDVNNDDLIKELENMVMNIRQPNN